MTPGFASGTPVTFCSEIVGVASFVGDGKEVIAYCEPGGLVPDFESTYLRIGNEEYT